MKTPHQPPPDLPPGQFKLGEFPRFGLPAFTDRFPRRPDNLELTVLGGVEVETDVADLLAGLPRIEQTSDFHCVTTWTHRGLRWSGYRFADVYRELVVPMARPVADIRFVVFHCQEGYRTSLPLKDLLADTVLLADRLDGKPLSIAHGAPLRLIAPDHYGYKNPKHLKAIELWGDEPPGRKGPFRFVDHRRARVAHEERGRGLPGWLLRYLYRPLIGINLRRYRRAAARRGVREK